MSVVGLLMNLLLVGLLLAALGVGVRLNRRLKALKDSQDGFAGAVRELNAAAQRAEQGLADLRAATDEATEALADRIEKGRTLAAKLERLLERAPANVHDLPEPPRDADRLGALLAATREGRAKPERAPPRELAPPVRIARAPDDDLFEDEPLTLDRPRGVRR